MNKIKETDVSRLIIKEFYKKITDSLSADVVIAGAGPSGLTAAYYLAKEGIKTVVFERALKPGGGMPGGGIMFNVIVLQSEIEEILKEIGITYKKENNYLLADSLEATSLLVANAIKRGAKVFNLMNVEDVVIKEDRVSGVVINWTAVELAGLHVDPVTVESRFVVDATGHDARVSRITEKKTKGKLYTPTGKIEGEGPMRAEDAETFVVKNTKEVYPGLYACGMAVNAVFGGPRMGPIFGGMLLSGKKVAEKIKEHLS